MVTGIEQTELNLNETLSVTEQALTGLDADLDSIDESSELPEGWGCTNLGSIIELKYGKSLPAKTRDGSGFPVYGSNGIVGYHSLPLLLTDAVIVGRKGSFGQVQLSVGGCFPIDTTYYVDHLHKQPIKFWYYQLRHLPLTTLNRSTAIPGLNRDDAYAQLISLPSLAEQKVIAQTLDITLAQVDNIKTRLDAIPKILKTFRQSVLAAAVSGKLTEELREENECVADSDLVNELKFSCKKARKIEATSFHELVTSNFPSSWSVSAFTDMYKFIDYRGKTPKKSDYGKRLYTAKNIKMGYVKDNPIEFLSEEDYFSWMTRGFSKLGDIFFVTEGHTMGCVALNDIGSDIALAQRTLTLQPFGKVDTKFHYLYMLTDNFQKMVDLNATGTAAKGIKAAKFRGLPLPFPSYKEQTEIVRRVEELFTFADQIEKQVKNAQSRVNNLTQSILAKAFRGELTAQWRADNPDLISGENSAAALLARIQAEREALKPKKKTARKTKAKKETAN